MNNCQWTKPAPGWRRLGTPLFRRYQRPLYVYVDELLVVQLVSMAIAPLILQPVCERLVQHRWKGAQLAELEQALAAKDFLTDYELAMWGERVFGITAVEDQRITRKYTTAVDDGHGKSSEKTMSMWYFPSAFFYLNELNLARLDAQFILPLVDATNRLVSPTTVRQTAAELGRQAQHFSFYRFEGLAMLQPVAHSVKRFDTVQSAVDLAKVTRALERYRLAHGNYPETLGSLAPQHLGKLPHEIINGKPLHYQRTEGRNFILASVGWNEKDDGGQVGFAEDGNVDRDPGDWVWNSAAK